MVVVRFKRAVYSERYDACGPGDLLRCDEAFARHVVHDLGAAEYVQPMPQASAAPAPIVRRRRSPAAETR